MCPYDSLKQDKREFVPRDGDRVTMYFRGPTVYNYIHLGNARPYVLGMAGQALLREPGLARDPRGELEAHDMPRGAIPHFAPTGLPRAAHLGAAGPQSG